MRLVQKYSITTILVSQFFLFNLSVNAEVAPSPNVITEISPSPEIISSPVATPASINNEDIEKIKEEREEIKKIAEPKVTKPIPTSTPSVNVKPTPTPTIIKPISTSKPLSKIKTPKKNVETQVKKDELKKENISNIPIKIKENPNSKFVLKPGKITPTTYTVEKGDNLYTLSKKLNIRYKTLLSMNNTTSPYLIVGQKIIIDKSMKPTADFDGIVVNIPEKRLYHFNNGSLEKVYVVSVGLPSPEWQTPVGNYKIMNKVKDPIWKVPLSIQKEMAAKGQVVKKEVPAGPGNPLGKWWMSLSGGLGIHSTNAPLSVGYSVSHGCIRMRPLSAAELWNKIPKNTPVKIIYQPVKLSVDDNNKIFIEVFRDIYSKTPDINKYTKTMINDFNLDPHIDWKKVDYAIRNKRGISIPISKSL